MSDIACEEWDFSDCPDEQLDACRNYEFGRESENIRERVRLHRAALGNPTFEKFLAWHNGDGPPESITNAEWEAVCFFFPGIVCWEWLDEFPRIPFLRVPAVRREVFAVEKGRWSAITENFSEMLKHYPQLREQTGEMAIRVSEDTTAAAFEINWTRSDDELVRHFKDWLKTFRKKPDSIREMRGAGSEPRQLRKDLKHLGTWRLLNKMSWEAAYELTRERLKKGLWCNRPEVWTRGLRAAEKLLGNTHG